MWKTVALVAGGVIAFFVGYKVGQKACLLPLPVTRSQTAEPRSDLPASIQVDGITPPAA